MAGLERVFRIDEEAGVIAVDLAYEDVPTREQIKARGYRWDSRQREWRLVCGGPAAVRAEALALLELGLRLRAGLAGAGNPPLALAETAIRYALPLPFPVAFWGRDDNLGLDVAGSTRLSYTFTCEGDWDGPLLHGRLESVSLGERGRRWHERAVEDGEALPLPAEAR